MRKLILLLFLASAQVSFSQQWCPPGAEWTYNFYSRTGSGYRVLTYEKDTTLLGQPCKMITGKQVRAFFVVGLDTLILPNIYTFAKNDSIFFWSGDEFYPAYMFNSQKGDTLSCINPNNSCFWRDSTYRHIVDSSSQVTIGNHSLRYYSVTNMAPDAFPYPEQIQVVERLGTLNNYIFPDVICVTDADDYSLRCYKDDSFELYQTNTTIACNHIYTSIPNEIFQPGVKLFPNPASQSFQVQLSATPPTETYLQLYDATGRMIKLERITEPLTTIQRVGIASGIYFWQLSADNKITGRGKIILE